MEQENELVEESAASWCPESPLQRDYCDKTNQETTFFLCVCNLIDRRGFAAHKHVYDKDCERSLYQSVGMRCTTTAARLFMSDATLTLEAVSLRL